MKIQYDDVIFKAYMKVEAPTPKGRTQENVVSALLRSIT